MELCFCVLVNIPKIMESGKLNIVSDAGFFSICVILKVSLLPENHLDLVCVGR